MTAADARIGAKLEQISSALRQGRALLERVGPAHYRAPARESDSGSIGMQMRHVLDHVQSFVDGVQSGLIDYEARVRGTVIERDPHVAIALIDRQGESLDGLRRSDLPDLLAVRVHGGAAGAGYWSSSSTSRELEFLLSHTIHHYALIAVLCTQQGILVGTNFGVAPATLDHRVAAQG